MIQCAQCEFCEVGPDGQIKLNCHPFQNIKEPECLMKWQLLKLDLMTRAYMSTIAHYKKLAPLQEKMMKAMEREIDDLDEADSWKLGHYEENEEDEDDKDDDGTLP